MAAIAGRLLARREVTESGCWVWLGNRTPRGYGQIHVDGATAYVHRAAYEVWIGPIRAGLVIDHLCRNAACFNPAHLEAVPQAVNVQRGDHAKLTGSQVTEIRALCSQGWIQRDIAAAYGVSAQSVTGIKLAQTWAEGGAVHAAAA